MSDRNAAICEQALAMAECRYKLKEEDDIDNPRWSELTKHDKDWWAFWMLPLAVVDVELGAENVRLRKALQRERSTVYARCAAAVRVFYDVGREELARAIEADAEKGE